MDLIASRSGARSTTMAKLKVQPALNFEDIARARSVRKRTIAGRRTTDTLALSEYRLRLWVGARKF